MKKKTVDPMDILTKTPFFIIMKNGDTHNISDVEIVESKCIKCGAIRREHMSFIGGKCNKCWVEANPIGPQVETEWESVPLLEEDSCNFSGSGFLTTAYWKETHAEMGHLGLKLANGRELIYIDVPKSVWTDLTKAESAGKFYNKHIKGVFLQQLDEEARRGGEKEPTTVPVS